MKKTFLFAALLPAILFAQIGPIQTTGENYHRVGTHMLNYPRTNRYVLLLSDGTEEVRLNLGVGPTEAATSLSYLYETIFEEGKSFTLQGRVYDVRDNKICVHDTYALDGLCITEPEIRSEFLTLIMEQGAEYGEITITQGSKSIGSFVVLFHKYGIADGFYFGFDVSDSLSRRYNDFEQISLEDMRILRDLITENYTSVTHALFGITACDVVLGDEK